MNVGIVLAAMVILSAVSLGIIGMASYHSDPVSDTMGNTYNNDTNRSIAAGQVVTTTTAEVGGIGTIILAVIFVFGAMIAVLGLILYKRGSNSFSRR